MAEPVSQDEMVARVVIDRVFSEAKQMAAIRGTPAGLRAATPEEELRLFNEWDESVDPQAVMAERTAFHLQNGLQPEDAYVEAILETCAAGFKNRLRMAQGNGRLTLTEQCRFLEDLAKRSRAAREAVTLSNQGASYQSGTDSQITGDAGLGGGSVQPPSFDLGAE